jgi:hypothetical protein
MFRLPAQGFEPRGMVRACLETQKLEQLEARMDGIAGRVARDRTNAALRARGPANAALRARGPATHESQRASH